MKKYVFPLDATGHFLHSKTTDRLDLFTIL